MNAITLAVAVLGTAACQAQATDDWELATPASVGLDSALLEQLRRDGANGTFPNIHAVLVARDGRLVMEEYFNGFDRETRQYTASVSKSVGSMLLGIAIAKGLVPGVEAGGVHAPLIDVLPSYAPALTDPDKQGLTLHHVLTMSAGLEWDEQSLPYSDPRNDWIQASRSEDPVGFMLARPIVAEPGSSFNYNGGLAITLAHLVEHGAGMAADRFAEQYLFSPLGITDFEWEHLPNGMTDTDGGLHLRPRDMAKLGQLYLNGGLWRGSRVVRESWVRESVREHIVTEGQPNYGYQWWCGDFHYADRSAYTFFASGHGGQKIYVFPDLDLVVVLAHEVFDNPMGEVHNSAILARYVLPAADPSASWGDPVTLDAATLSRYVGEYVATRDRFTIVYREGSLVAMSEGSPPLALTPLTETRFRGTLLDLVDVDLEFDVAADGTARSVRARFTFNDRTYQKVNER
jgi:CubicO group peptidase (beta-lactamase class C family)